MSSSEIHEKAEGAQLSYGGDAPARKDDPIEREMKERVQAGYILESPDEMTPATARRSSPSSWSRATPSS